jgi:hypothetical protein
MSRLVVEDAALKEKMWAVKEEIELVDKAGRRLGWFRPQVPPIDYTEPEISEEELQRREQEGPGRTLAEIMADLEKMG